MSHLEGMDASRAKEVTSIAQRPSQAAVGAWVRGPDKSVILLHWITQCREVMGLSVVTLGEILSLSPLDKWIALG